MLVQEVMNKNVVVVKLETKIIEAIKILNEYRIGSLVVVNEEKKMVIRNVICRCVW